MRINTFLPSLLGPWKVPEENSFLIKVLKEDASQTSFRKTCCESGVGVGVVIGARSACGRGSRAGSKAHPQLSPPRTG